MQVKIRTIQNKEAVIEVDNDELISDVKCKVHSAFSHLDPEKQILIHMGKILSNEKTVKDYSLKENDKLVVMAQKKVVPSSTAAASVPNASEGGQASEPSSAGEVGTANSATPTTTATETLPGVKLDATPGSEVSAEVTADTGTTAPPCQGEPEGVVSSTTDSGGAESAFLGGSQLEQTIADIVAMGFPRERVEAAMEAAYRNPDRAVEYLMNGIPEVRQSPTIPESGDSPPTPPVVPVSQAPTVQVPPAAAVAQTAQPTDQQRSPLAVLRDHPMFERMRTSIQANPQILPQMLHVIGEQNPRLAQLIVQNQEEFLQMISEEGGEAPAAGGGGDAFQLRLTAEEAEAIQRLEGLGFPRFAAVQAYIACDKNEELAANYLFDNIADLMEDEEAPPATDG